MVEEVKKSGIKELIMPSIEEEPDEREKERLLREWKKSLSYYSLNPEDFKFKFSDL